MAGWWPLPGLICINVLWGRVQSGWCSSSYQAQASLHPVVSSSQSTAAAPDLGHAAVGWALWSREPSPSSCRYCLGIQKVLKLPSTGWLHMSILKLGTVGKVWWIPTCEISTPTCHLQALGMETIETDLHAGTCNVQEPFKVFNRHRNLDFGLVCFYKLCE